MYSYDDVYSATIEYFSGDEMATSTWISKYALRDAGGEYLELTPDDMHHRIAREFARIEAKYPKSMHEDEIYELLRGFKYIIPQGSPMSGIGNEHSIQSLSNCFVIDSPHDSYGGILHTDQEQVQIMKRRGGVGFDVSNIRPKGHVTTNAAKTSDGIGVFLERFSNSCREVAQGGRRGALMMSISCHHPQVRDFINIKRDRKKVTGANISVRITDEFMRAVKDGTDVQLRWPIDASKPIVDERVDARELWNEIITSAHECAEPGVMFWDTITRTTPSDAYPDDGFTSISSNPCSEICMSKDACRLIVVNLHNFVADPFTSSARFDHDAYADVVYRAQRLMDDLVDLELEKIDKIIEKVSSDPEPEHIKRIELDLWRDMRRVCKKGRRTGLGVTAVGDVIAMMGMKYGDSDSISFVERLYKELAVNSYRSSIDMAAERGHFECWRWENEEEHHFLQRIYDELDHEHQVMWQVHGRRNIANTTTAPCGSVSVLAKTTSGIEPAIFLRYTRRKKVNPDDENVRVDFIDDVGDSWMHFGITHHGVSRWLKSVKGWTDADIDAWDTNEMPVDDVLDGCPYLNATAEEIDWHAKIMMQGAAQAWICHAISNTTNLPEDVTVEQVADVYMAGYDAGCKGVTVYRKNSRTGVLIENEDDEEQQFDEHHAPKRPDVLPCDIHRCTIKGEEWTIFVGMMDDRPYEVFGGLSELIEIPRRFTTGEVTKRSFKMGGKYDLTYGVNGEETRVKDIVRVFDNPNYSSFTRMLSLSLRHGAPVRYIVEQLQRDKEADMYSFARVMARTLKKYIPDGTEVNRACGECGAQGSLRYIEGCVTCVECSASACG